MWKAEQEVVDKREGGSGGRREGEQWPDRDGKKGETERKRQHRLGRVHQSSGLPRLAHGCPASSCRANIADARLLAQLANSAAQGSIDGTEQHQTKQDQTGRTVDGDALDKVGHGCRRVAAR